MLGEASHGTSEFYQSRAELTKRLVSEFGFTIIGVEGDWPSIYKFNQYIKGNLTNGESAAQVLGQFQRWPTWMWANEEVAELAEWLRVFNESKEADQMVSFYGLDMYSLWESLEEVKAYALSHEDAETTALVNNVIQCFGDRRDEYEYAQSVTSATSCADELETLLEHLTSEGTETHSEALFNARQNALVVRNAERYYTVSLYDYSGSWNIRDRHMMQTINDVTRFHGTGSKMIIWEHNTHVGDARATDMQSQGMVNVGQLVREEHAADGVYVIGYGTNKGTVIAASEWGSATEIMNVPAAVQGSWENLLAQQGNGDKIVILDRLKDNPDFQKPIGHRAIGVVYDPAREEGNYVPSVLPERYDASSLLKKRVRCIRSLTANT